MLVGKMYDFKEFFKERFPTIKYLDLVFNGGSVRAARALHACGASLQCVRRDAACCCRMYPHARFSSHCTHHSRRDARSACAQVVKAAWVLPTSGQTDATGTLADFARSLGINVTEVDLDEDEDESDGDDDAEDREDDFIDREAEEDNETSE